VWTPQDLVNHTYFQKHVQGDEKKMEKPEPREKKSQLGAVGHLQIVGKVDSYESFVLDEGLRLEMKMGFCESDPRKNSSCVGVRRIITFVDKGFLPRRAAVGLCE